MSCYSPLRMWRGIDQDTGDYNWHILGKYDPSDAKLQNDLNYSLGQDLPVVYKIPCGKCIGCKLDYARQWSDRMLLELDTYQGKAIFLTLTYNDDHIPLVLSDSNLENIEIKRGFELNDDDCPIYGTLFRKDLTDFLKRLRFYYSERKLKYFACGEYGSNTLRPHYHLIIFGLSLSDFPNMRPCQKNELGQVSYTDERLEKIWSNGYILFSGVNYKTMNYVSRYSAKKIFGDNLSPGPFALESFVCMSRGNKNSKSNGIAYDFIKSHPDFFDRKYVFISDGENVKKVYFPKYGYKVLDLKNSLDYIRRVKEISDTCTDRELLKLWKTDLPYDQMLKVEESVKQVKVARLLRHRKEI